MRDYSVFDIVGPIMIEPSSSHTAGAARLAKVAAIIAEGKIIKAEFLLHGSFGETYKRPRHRQGTGSRHLVWSPGMKTEGFLCPGS